MIDIVKKFFSKGSKTNSGSPARAGSHDIRVATCALLLEMSHIDREFDPSEQDHIVSIMKQKFGLSDEQVVALMTLSQKELDNNIDLWRFASLINQNYSIPEKEAVIEMIWAVAYADSHVDKHEDYLVHKLAKLLRLSHKQLINAKLKVPGK